MRPITRRGVPDPMDPAGVPQLRTIALGACSPNKLRIRGEVVGSGITR